jgi:hypothetical protein
MDANDHGMRLMLFSPLGREPTRVHGRRKTGNGDGHPVPMGCAWFRTCDECGWPDCVAGTYRNREVYDEPASVATRAGWAVEAMSAARDPMTVGQVAGFFGATERDVERWIGEATE